MSSGFEFVNDKEIRVRYEETDQMGFVYYGKYFTWFEVGRTELLRALGLPYTDFEARGIMLPVFETDCQYKSSARYDDLINIRTTITKLTPVRIYFAYEILSADGRIVAHGSTGHAFVDTTGRPVNMSKKDPELWNQLTGLLT